MKKKPPGPSYFSFASEFTSDSLGYYLELMEDYGDIVKVPFFTKLYLVNNPDMIKYILKDNYENYYRQSFFARPLQLFLGNGLLNLQGAEWRKRRKTLAPIFQPKNIMQFAPIIQTITKTRLQTWDNKGANGSSFDISQEVLSMVYLIALKAFFNQEINETTLAKALDAVNCEHSFSMKFSSLLPWLPTIGVWRFRRAKKFLQKHIEFLIESNKQHPVDNFINVLLHTSDINDQPLSTQAIFDEAKTFLMTGHETTGNAIAWAMYLLADHPEKQKKLKEELKTVLAGRDPEIADLTNLPYTNAVFNESIRLYPPIWNTGRVCQSDDQIGEYFIPKGSKILICPYTLHRRELYWKNPLAFEPERHLLAEADKPPQFAFIPFGGGPRICIASHFGVMESVLIIAMIMQRFTLTLDPAHPIELEPAISLKPKYGIKVFAEKTGGMC